MTTPPQGPGYGAEGPAGPQRPGMPAPQAGGVYPGQAGAGAVPPGAGSPGAVPPGAAPEEKQPQSLKAKVTGIGFCLVLLAAVIGGIWGVVLDAR